MRFEIDFNQNNHSNDEFFINELGAVLVPTGSDKYPPFEKLEIEVRDFEELEEILEVIDIKFDTISSAVISFDPPTIFIEL